ncbi:hypothetical protein RJ639_030814 [Escallonia herrerae]|uniref:GAG-pre-integrase domain-containing protein n=1 Tax=Escallonia herrerae TaxID=1293975 RepID=A0AA88X187_9ASTE|nr:hypothetical protein RJ639_030814 [Escallonia herrerae]
MIIILKLEFGSMSVGSNTDRSIAFELVLDWNSVMKFRSYVMMMSVELKSHNRALETALDAFKCYPECYYKKGGGSCAKRRYQGVGCLDAQNALEGTKYNVEETVGHGRLMKTRRSVELAQSKIPQRHASLPRGLLKALKGKQGLPDTMSDDEKEDMLERAHSALLLGEEHGDGLIARGRSTDHAGSKSKGRSRSQSKTRKLKCYHRHKQGHYRKDCPERKRKKKDNSKMADAGVVEDNSDGADVLSVTISSSDRGWILDTGCSFHMCPNRDWFVTYRSFDGGKVVMGNDVAYKVVGIGSIQIKMHDGIVRTLTDVRHVLELRKILISLGTLDSNGCSYQAVGEVIRIMKGVLVVMQGLKQNSLYLLQDSTVTGAGAVAVVATASSSDIDSDTTKLWHMRLGHMSERGMDVLSKQCLLGSKKIGKLDFCEHCVFGKQCRVKFSQAVHTTKGTVDYIHSDLWGPSTVPSNGGGRYMLTFMDDFSRKVWVDVTFDESSMLLKKKELIDAGKGHGVREKVELEVRAPNSLPNSYR